MIAGVLKTEPAWKTLPPATPPALRRLLRRCLEKDPRQRLRDIGDARVALEEIVSGNADEPEDAGAVSAKASAQEEARAGRRRVFVAAAVAAAVTALATGGVLFLLHQTPRAPQTVRLEMSITGDQPLLQIQGSAVVLSPDGRYIAYVTGSPSDISATRLSLRFLGRLEDTPLLGTEASYNPFFSPDGQWIGFVTPQALKKVSISGGTPLVLCPVALSRGATWGKNGTIVFAPNPASGLMMLPAAGGAPSPLTTLDKGESGHRWPQFLPDGERVIFTSYSSGDRNMGTIEVVDLKTKKRTVLHRGGTYARYASSGHLLFLNQGTLFAAPVDLAALKLTALPAPVLQNVTSNIEGGGQYDVSENGSIVYLTGQASGTLSSLVTADLSGRLTPLPVARREYQTPPRLSPDGRRIAVAVIADGNTDIWILDPERDTQTRLTFDPARDLYPVWSQDGRDIYFTSDRNSKWEILRKHADGTGDEEVMLASDVETDAYSTTPDGRFLAYHVLAQDGDPYVLPLQGDRKPHAIFTSKASEGDPVFSPNGRWMTYDSDESGRWEVYVRPANGEGSRWQVSGQGGEFARWSKDGTTIFYQERARAMWRVPVREAGAGLEIGKPEKLFDLAPGMQSDWDLGKDGRFLMIQSETAASAGGRNMLKLGLNWFEELKATLSAGR
jgi:serine/threonine-protein kinase